MNSFVFDFSVDDNNKIKTSVKKKKHKTTPKFYMYYSCFK